MNAIDEPLEPPGTITVIGAGTVGLEAGLYARCLGYDVTILEAEAVGQAWRDREAASAPLPFLPDRGVSRLAMTAVQTQHAASGAAPRPLPLTVSQWIEEVLEDLAASDLLAGRVHTGCRVETIQPVAIEPAIAEAGEAEGEDPALPEEAPAAADFWVSYRTEEGTLQRQQAEAVIDTTSGAGIAIQGFAATSLAGTETPDADFR